AHRYGWVPEDQPGKEHKSITWLECREAAKNDQEVLAFLVDEEYDWPEKLREDYQLTAAIREGTATPELFNRVQRNVAALREFKAWLGKDRVFATFTTPDELSYEIVIALKDWLKRHPEVRVEPPGDPGSYLQALREETAYIDIRGLQVGSGKANRFPIEDLYISLQTAPAQEPGKDEKFGGHLEARPKRLKLEQALTDSRLVVLGDPGAGKTTFLRRICQLACRGLLEDDSEALQTLGVEEASFPIFIRLSELQEHRTKKDLAKAPSTMTSPDWLAHFLGSHWTSCGLDAEFFQMRLRKGPSLLLLDGLDEAPSQRERKSLVKLIEKGAARWNGCRIVVTSRPAAYHGESVLTGFAHASIEALEDSAIQTFLSHWCRALFPSQPNQAERHLKELSQALQSRYEIRRMARNPVMLTALAVVHWNEKRIPEQRADLYESILTWLSRSREDLPHRPSPERSLGLLQTLALAMHDHEKGRQVQVSRRWAAEAIAGTTSPKRSALSSPNSS
ncbi:MAG: NACHT domain-containing protein, partial [Acidobacteriota bacterium]